MECYRTVCHNIMWPAKMTEPDGEETLIWYCTCGVYYEVPIYEPAEVSAWNLAWEKLSSL